MACHVSCLPVVQRLIQSRCNNAATTNVSLFVCNIFCDNIQTVVCTWEDWQVSVMVGSVCVT